MTPIERLLQRILRARVWPLPAEAQVRRYLRIWSALRESTEPAIRALMEWPGDRPLIIDNLPEKIAGAYGDLLFGQAPQWTPAATADEQRMTEMVSTWSDELPGAEETCASEGEVWWRLSLDGVTPHPVLTWHSRVDVVPLLHGRNVLACAFVSVLDAPRKGEVWRHLEVHGHGEVRNLLFVGRANALGRQVELSRHTETEILVDRWEHGLGRMIAGRVVNKWGRRPIVGRSMYAGVWTRFLALNEATTIGRENMKLTAKKRAVVPASALRSRVVGDVIAGEDRGDGSFEQVRAPAPRFDAGEDVLAYDPLDADEGGSSTPPFRILEYSFDAVSLIAWLQFEIETVCMRCDLVPQFIGSGDFGQGNSGTALRVRLLPTTNAADAAGRPWDGELPEIAQSGALLEQLPVSLGGLDRQWTDAGAIPDVERSDPLPQDENEVADRHSTLKTASLISIETSLRERYPDRDETFYTEERERILADDAATLPPTFGSATAAGNGDVTNPPGPSGGQQGGTAETG